MKNICFTGHRNVKMTQELKERLYNLLEKMIQNGAVNFYAECELAVLKLREKYKNIKLHIIMPCPKEEQTKKWKQNSDREQYDKILSLADSTELCSEHYDKNCMKKRNARLVKCADCCICYYYKSRSGTGQTVRMAQKKKLEIINLYE